jgi:hypothetical protein
LSELGIFNREGVCLDSGFSTFAHAEAIIRLDFDDAPGLYARHMCPDHEDQAAGSCNACEEDE